MCYLVQISESDPRITRDLQTGGVVLQLQVLHSERRSEGLRGFWQELSRTDSRCINNRFLLFTLSDKLELSYNGGEERGDHQLRQPGDIW